MNLLTWLDALSRAATPDAAPRRAALTRLGRAALAAVPALTLATSAVAGPPRPESYVTDRLNLLLRVALAQQALFTTGLLNTPNGTAFPSADARALFVTLQALADDSVARLRTAIERSGDVAATPANYDFTGGQGSSNGPLHPFGASASFADFIGLAQALTDLYSRALITLLGLLQGGGTFTDLVAQLLATNSRMAALIRRQAGTTPWITQTNLGSAPSLLAAFYDGEANTKQFGLELTTTGANAVLPAPQPATAVLTEAFDEPLPIATGETYPVRAVETRLALLTY